MQCPKCKSQLEYIADDYPTGVVAPDGYRETCYQSGFYCEKCDQYFEESDIESDCASHSLITSVGISRERKG